MKDPVIVGYADKDGCLCAPEFIEGPYVERFNRPLIDAQPNAHELLKSLWNYSGLRSLMRPDQVRRIAAVLGIPGEYEELLAAPGIHPITPAHIRIMKHALGIKKPGAEAFRNHYTVDGENDESLPLIRELEAMGYMQLVPRPKFAHSNDLIFKVTKYGEALDAVRN